MDKRTVRHVMYVLAVMLCASVAGAQENTWIVAAERFSSERVPAPYATFDQLIPTLVLQRLTGFPVRQVTALERENRIRFTNSEKRISLIRERAALITERDRIFLSSDSQLLKMRKRSEAEKKILEKEREIAQLAPSLSPETGVSEKGDNMASISVWKKAESLFSRDDSVSLNRQLQLEGISALITGTIEDMAGYCYVAVTVHLPFTGSEPIVIREAGLYEDISSVVDAIVSRLVPEVANSMPAFLVFTCEPEDARIFLDSRRIELTGEPVPWLAGDYLLSASADGFSGSEQTVSLKRGRTYSIRIQLEPVETVSITFSPSVSDALLYVNTLYYGQGTQTLSLPAFRTIAESEINGVSTFFILPVQKDARYTVSVNTEKNAERIEKQRRFMYQSLGLLYISMPFAMLTYGSFMNKYAAYNNVPAMQNEKTLRELERLALAADVSRFVSIGLGVNVVIQIIRYLRAADRTMPQYAESSENGRSSWQE